MKKFFSNLELTGLNFPLVLSLTLTAFAVSIAVSRITHAAGVEAALPSSCSTNNSGYQPVPPTESGPGPSGLDPVDHVELNPNFINYECLANNVNCTVFYVIDPNPNVAQDAAMSRCFSFGLPCRPLGCHPLP